MTDLIAPYLHAESNAIRSNYDFRLLNDSNEHLASVTLEVSPDEDDVIVYSRAALETFLTQQNAQRAWYSEWVSAAKTGARAAALHLRRQGLIKGCRITLLSVAGTRPETDANAVFCAATFAAWQALTRDIPLPELDLIDNRYVPYFGPITIAESI